MVGNFFRKAVNLFRKGTTILGMKSTVLEGYINKTHFFQFAILRSFFGSSLVSPWSFIRSIYIRYKGRES